MRYQDILNWMYRQEAVRQNTIKIDIEDGRIVFRPVVTGTTQAFDTLRGGTEYIQSLGLTGVQEYSSELPFGSQGMMQDLQKRLAKQGNYSINVESYNLDDPSQAEILKRNTIRNGEAYGVVTYRDKKAVVQRIFKDGEELVEKEVMDIFRQHHGIAINPTVDPSKFNKRIAAYTTAKRVEGIFDSPIRVSLTDARADIAGLSLDERTRALDGAWEVSTFHLERQKAVLEDALEELNRSRRVVTDRRQIVQIEANITKLTSGLREIDGAITGRNQTFNARLLNMELIAGEGMSQETLEELHRTFEKYGASGKGNATVSSNLDATNKAFGWVPGIRPENQSDAFLAQAIDFRTDRMNIKGGLEDGFGSILGEVSDGVIKPKVPGFGAVTLEGQKIGDLYADYQSMVSHPGLYDQDLLQEMMERTEREYLEMADALKRPGELPHMLREMLERQAGIAEGMQRYQIDMLDPITQREALDVLARIDRGESIADNPLLQGKMTKLIEKGVTRKGVIRMRVPDAMRAYVGTTVSDRVFQGELQPGQIALSTNNRLIMTPEDFSRYYPNLGGADLDDALSSMIRIDDKTGRLKMSIARSPTATGEIAFLDVHNEDEVFKHLLVKRMSEEDKYQQLSKAMSREELLAKTLMYDDEFANFLNKRATRELRAAVASGDYRAIRKITGRLKGAERIYGNIDIHDHVFKANKELRRGRSAALIARLEVEEDMRFLQYQRLLERLRTTTGTEHTRAVTDMNQFLTGRIGLRVLSADAEARIPQRAGEKIPLFTRNDIEYYRYAGEDAGVVYQKPVGEAIKTLRYEEAMSQGMSPAEFRAKQLTRMGDEIANAPLLGMFSNARMLLDDATRGVVGPDLSNTTADEFFRMLDEGRILSTLEQEQAIDAIKGMVAGMDGGAVRDIIKKMQRHAVLNVMQAHQRGEDLKIDLGLIKESIDDPELQKIMAEEPDAGRITKKTFRDIMDDIKKAHPDLGSISFDQITYEGPMFNVLKQTAEAKRRLREIQAGITFDDSIMNMDITNRGQARKDVRTLKDEYYKALKSFDDINELADVGDLLALQDDGRMAAMRMQTMENGMLRALAETFEFRRAPDGRLERVAGQRTYEALALLARDEKDDFIKAFDSGGLMQGLLKYSRGEEFEDVTLDALNRARGTALLEGPEVNRVIKEAIGEAKFNQLSNISTMLMALPEDRRSVSQTVFDMLNDITTKDPTKIFIPRATPQIGSLLDPATLIRNKDEVISVGDLIMDMSDMSKTARDRRNARNIFKRATASYFDAASQFAAEGDIPEDIAEAIGKNLPPGTRKAEVGEAAARASAEIIEPKSGFTSMLGDVLGTRAGRFGLAGVGVAIAAAMLHTSKRDGDRTLEELQGPSNLPGGNPYTRIRGLPNFDGPMVSSGSGSGMTYQVRGNGGSQDDFVSALNDLTGSNVSTTTYDRGFQPRIEDLL